MKVIAPALLASLAKADSTIATLWKVVRRDGLIYGFTDHDKDLIVSGLTYLAGTGFTASAIKSSLGLNVDDLEVSGAFDSSAISEDDLLAGLWDHAEVTVMRCDWSNPLGGVVIDRFGKIGEVTLANEFTAELRSLSQMMQQPVGRVVAATCDATLGDARCKVLMAPHTFAAVVTGVTSRKSFTASSLAAFASADFVFGNVTFSSGANNGVIVEIKTFSAGVFGLHIDAPNDIQIGDFFTVVKGCAKTVAACQSFNNILNMRAFPFRPVTDEITSGPDR